MIKFLDLNLVNEVYETDFKKSFKDFLKSGHYILGNQVSEFENEFASFCGTEYCIGVSSGLDALQLIFEAYKVIGRLSVGDEVLVPANTYIASVLAISNAGLKPVLIEPCLKTYNIDSSEIEANINAKTKAILGVHLYGQLYNVSELEHISKKYNLLLIEDAAQAHGATYTDGRVAGNLSAVAAFSFYPTKNLGALGDAGAVTTNDKQLAEVIFKLRNYGRISTYKNELQGYNCRLDELQATFLRIKLKKLRLDNKERQKLAQLYINNIDNNDVVLPFFNDINQHVFHLFVIRSEKRDLLKAYLLKNNVQTLIHYPLPIHKQPAYKQWTNFRFPYTEKIHDEVLSLPLYPRLSVESLHKVCALINSF
ncbi:DegT/DnrJ/EryC1/StrS family aminotransferase [Hyunsoonleella pacifica]|uniref:DegT/DnrJ/EryC1/StrS family aminotransferase n=1 Tax=Hyunsoonleella pacifica TaxID=1080224 RepID=A0A4Q9FNK8_9FLAO|nr:DegT/DnrJ/EryC1/StrS family aminotransferase [Hyunsoonleella pacifica]TBN13921.1 DegT/DnrJ/EryC1/StrS family aminotransferase [Hyunsoonleella pacifica]GGD26798.1 aminotransferase [Hyunsoonleella pacifica]